MNEIIKMHQDCITQVHANDYYLNRFQEVAERMNLAWVHPETDDLDMTTLCDLENPEMIVSFWNKFWCMLPDSPSIHRKPFYQICDICEYDYREDDERTN